MPCDRAVFNEVEKLVRDVAEFATKLAATLADAIDSLPSPARLMEMVGDFIKEKLLNDGGLCFAPSCPGIHINTGVEEDLVPDMDDLEILASHHITHAYRPCNVAHTTLPTQRISPTRVSKTPPYTRIALTNRPCHAHTVSATREPPRVVQCGRRSPHCPFASRCLKLGSMQPA